MKNVSTQRPAHTALLILGILAIAANLRAPVTGVAPLLGQIRDSEGLGTAAAGVLTTLPLVAFGAISPFAVLLAGRHGLERALFAALLLVGGGIALRSAGAVWCLYLGTWIIGSGIAIGNVLLPSLLKRDFPERVALLTASYAFTMGAVAALVSALAVPITHAAGRGWSFTLLTVAVLPAVAALLWLPQLGLRDLPAQGTATLPRGARIWRSGLAWQVTLFLGCNSFMYYIVIGWLPVILIDEGYSPAQAGTLHGLMQLATAVPGLLLIPAVNRMRDQRAIACFCSLVTFGGLLGLILAPGWAVLWTLMFGAGAGATIILGLAFVGLRSSSARQAASLSGMAQGVGYLLAAIGPTLAGIGHDLAHGWDLPLGICAGASLVMALLGLGAGRARRIPED